MNNDNSSPPVKEFLNTCALLTGYSDALDIIEHLLRKMDQEDLPAGIRPWLRGFTDGFVKHRTELLNLYRDDIAQHRAGTIRIDPL